MRLYRERVDKHRDREVFMSLQMGVELVRKELVAFHVDIHANKVILILIILIITKKNITIFRIITLWTEREKICNSKLPINEIFQIVLN